MTDYYSVIDRAVATLTENTVDSRRALYDRARAAQTAQLRRYDPPLANNDFERERSALEDAIDRIENEIRADNEITHRQTLPAHQPNTETDPQVAQNQQLSASSLISTPDQRNTPTSKRILNFISSAALGGLGIVVMLLLAAIPTALVLGGSWAAEKVLDYLVWPVDIALLLCVLVFLPLSLFRATRSVSAIGFLISSYVFGASAWFAGLLASYIYFGTFWTVLALFVAGVGVVPLGIIGALVHTDWMAAGLLFGGLVLTYGARAMGAWMAAKVENDRNTPISTSPVVATSPSTKQVFSAKPRWTKIGAVIGLILAAIDLLFLDQRNVGETNLLYILGFLSSPTILGALVGFITGAVKDFISSRSVGHRPNIEQRVVEGQPVIAEQTRRTNKLNIISMHWRGLYPLWVSYWAINVVAYIVIVVVAIIISTAFASKSGYDPLAIFASVTSLWSCILAIVIWQIVGAWRSANNYAAKRLTIGRKAPWAIIAKIALALAVINLANTFVSTALPELSEATRMAFMGDPDIPTYSLRIMRNGTEAEITGGFKYGLTDDFSKLLKASRQIRVVHLNSIGGRIGEAEKLYNVIREGQLITFVQSRCLSACTIAFAGGKERYIAQGAVLGFHEPAFPGMNKDDVQSSVVEQSQIFRAAGFSTDFVNRALSTPNSKMWNPTVAELIAAHVITGVSDGTQFAASGLGDATKESLAANLANAIPLLAEIKERLPQGYDTIIDAFYEAYLAGDTEADALAAARAKLMPLLASLKPLADDDVLLDLARLYGDEYQALGLKSSQLCYLYASGTDTTRNYSAELPSTLIKRELELNERIVHTAAQRTPVSAAVLEPIWKEVFVLMSAQGLTDSQMDLLTADNIPLTKYGDYCTVSVGLYKVVGSLPQKDSAAIMRAILAAATNDP